MNVIHEVTKTALCISLLVALRLISDNHQRSVLVSFDMRSSIDPCFSYYSWEVLTNVQFISGCIHLEYEPIEYLLVINHCLVNPNLHYSLPLKMPGVAHSYVMPV